MSRTAYWTSHSLISSAMCWKMLDRSDDLGQVIGDIVVASVGITATLCIDNRVVGGARVQNPMHRTLELSEGIHTFDEVKLGWSQDPLPNSMRRANLQR